MDLERLGVSVKGFEPSEDGRTYNYSIEMRYGAIGWQLLRRFSQFHSLHNQLFSEGFAALPHIPGKSLTRPNDPETARRRQLKLHRYLLGLLVRPDLRHSAPVMQFLDFEDHTNIPVCDAKLSVVGECHHMCSKYAATAACYEPERRLLWVSFEDATPLSRLGKAWTMVEPELVGATCLHTISICAGEPNHCSIGEEVNPLRRVVWGGVSPEEATQANSYRLWTSVVADCQQPQRVTCCEIQDFGAHGLHLISGTELGELLVQTLEVQQDGSYQLVLLRRHELHIKARILVLEKVGDLLLSIGSDNAVKCLAIPKEFDGEYNLLSSGRVVKPLDKKEVLTALHFRAAEATAIIGTSNAKLLFYDMTTQPPRFILTYPLIPVIEALEVPKFAYPVLPGTAEEEKAEEKATRPPVQLRVYSICVSRGCLYVGVESVVLIFLLDPFLAPDAPVVLQSTAETSHILGKLDCPLNPGMDISAMCVLPRLAHTHDVLIVAHYRTLIFWDLQNSQVLQCCEHFGWGRIQQLRMWDMPVDVSTLEAERQKRRFSRETTTEHIPLLAVATTNKGIQFVDVSKIAAFRIWEAGLQELQALCAERNVNQIRYMKDIQAKIRAGELEDLGDTVSDVDDDDDDILAAFGPAVY